MCLCLLFLLETRTITLQLKITRTLFITVPGLQIVILIHICLFLRRESSRAQRKRRTPSQPVTPHRDWLAANTSTMAAVTAATAATTATTATMRPMWRSRFLSAEGPPPLSGAARRSRCSEPCPTCIAITTALSPSSSAQSHVDRSVEVKQSKDRCLLAQPSLI